MGADAGGYRLYLFDPSGPARGERATARIVLDARSEAEALKEAEHLRGRRPAELWLGEHLVKIFDGEAQG